MKINVAIIASGNGTRMVPITGGFYPKILASTGECVLLERIVDNIRSIVRNLYIVAKEEDLKQIREWMVTNINHSINFPVHYVVHNQSNGSNRALKTLQLYIDGYDHETSNDRMLIHWSDITSTDLSYALGCMRWEKNNIGVICKEDAGCRFEMNTDNRIYSVNDTGNVVGMYLINDFMKLYLHEDCVDFIDELLNHYYKNTIKIDIQNFMDIGDEHKYLKVLNEYDTSTRYFNSIFIDEARGTVTKTAMSHRGASVMANEINWYEHINSDHKPRILDSKVTCDSAFIEMQYIQGLTIQEYYDCTHSDIIWPAVREAFDSIHGQGETQTTAINTDILKEYVYTIHERVNEITSILPSPFMKIKMDEDVYVAGSELEYTIKRFEKYLSNQLFDICPIHGDPNSCNMLIDHHQKVWFIDPRGKFGHTVGIYGDKDYDIAKFIYGISGYAKFNLMKGFIINAYAILQLTREFDEAINHAMEMFGVINTWYIRALIGMIWLKLTGYIKNEPNKSIFAFYFGLYLLKTSLDQLEK